VAATFFLIGHKAERHRRWCAAILDAGHTVGVHSYAHDRLFALRGERRVRHDLERGIADVRKTHGPPPDALSAPIGHTNPTIARAADALGLVVVGWTIGGRDGSRPGAP